MAKSKLVEANEKIADTVTTGFKKMSDGVVSGYQKIEDAVVGGYTKIEDKFVDSYLTHDGETVEEAKKRLKEKEKKREEEQNKIMESRRIEGHIYEYVEGSKDSVWLIDNNLNNGDVFEERQQEVFKDAQEGDIFEYIDGKYKIKK